VRRILSACALLIALTLLLASPAGAQVDDPNYPGTPGTDVDPDVIENPSDPDGPVVEEDVTTRTPVADTEVAAGGLPVTGGDVVGLAAIGFGAVVIGTALTTYRRRTIG
jgi:hypothetical protein